MMHTRFQRCLRFDARLFFCTLYLRMLVLLLLLLLLLVVFFFRAFPFSPIFSVTHSHSRTIFGFTHIARWDNLPLKKNSTTWATAFFRNRIQPYEVEFKSNDQHTDFLAWSQNRMSIWTNTLSVCVCVCKTNMLPVIWIMDNVGGRFIDWQFIQVRLVFFFFRMQYSNLPFVAITMYDIMRKCAIILRCI